MFKDWLKQEREARGLTQDELGARIGTSGAYIGHLEAGRRTPGLNILIGLSQAFDMGIDAIRKEALDTPQVFPAARFRAAGLSEDHIARLSRLWLRYPERRLAYLEKANKLARALVEFEDATVEDDDPKGTIPQIEPTPHPIAS